MNTVSEGRACRIRLEGPACQVRCATIDYPCRFAGHDKHAPPIPFSEGRACRVRRARLDDPSRFNGHDKHAPPTCRLESAAPLTNLTKISRSMDKAGCWVSNPKVLVSQRIRLPLETPLPPAAIVEAFQH